MAIGSKAAKGGKTALLGGFGGLLAAGLKMLVEPMIFKDSSKIASRWWMVPVGEVAAGAVGGAFDKTALFGAGLAGAGVAHLVENGNAMIQAKKQAAANDAPATTQGFGDYNVGALVEPLALDAGAMSGPGFNVGTMASGPGFNTGIYDEAGALVQPGRRG